MLVKYDFVKDIMGENCRLFIYMGHDVAVLHYPDFFIPVKHLDIPGCPFH